MLEALESGGKEVEGSARSMRCGEESEMSEIVPGGGCHPGVLCFGALGADKTGRVSDAESANGADIEEEGVVDVLRDEAVSEVLMKGRRLGDGDGARAAE